MYDCKIHKSLFHAYCIFYIHKHPQIHSVLNYYKNNSDLNVTEEKRKLVGVFVDLDIIICVCLRMTDVTIAIISDVRHKGEKRFKKNHIMLASGHVLEEKKQDT